MPMTKDRFIEILEVPESAMTAIDLLPDEAIASPLAGLNKALAAPYPNYNHVSLSDFNFQAGVVSANGSSRIYCCFERVGAAEKTLASDVLLWAGPRNDYWVIVAELTGLK